MTAPRKLRLIMSLDDISDAILAMRTAKELIACEPQGSKDIICVFENKKTFYATRNKSGSITIRSSEPYP